MQKEKILKIIISNTGEMLPELNEHEFVPSDRLVNLGANSNRAENVAMTMEELNLQIPRVELFGTKNIGDLTEAHYGKSKFE